MTSGPSRPDGEASQGSGAIPSLTSVPGRNEVILKESVVPIPTAMLSVVTANSNDLEFSQEFRIKERKWLKMGQLQGKRFSQRLFASCQPLLRECEPWTVANHSRPTPNSKNLSMHISCLLFTCYPHVRTSVMAGACRAGCRWIPS